MPSTDVGQLAVAQLSTLATVTAVAVASSIGLPSNPTTASSTLSVLVVPLHVGSGAQAVPPVPVTPATPVVPVVPAVPVPELPAAPVGCSVPVPAGERHYEQAEQAEAPGHGGGAVAPAVPALRIAALPAGNSASDRDIHVAASR